MVKISQIATGGSASKEDLTPLQGMIYDEISRRPDEVFEAKDEGLLRMFPKLKESALSWSLWSLHQKGYVQKMKVRLNGRLATVYGLPQAIEQLKAHLGKGDAMAHPTQAIPTPSTTGGWASEVESLLRKEPVEDDVGGETKAAEDGDGEEGL